MSSFYTLQIGAIGCGLTNQIYSLVNGIIIAHHEKKRFVIAHDFNQHFSKVSPCAISEIIDLVYLNENIKRLNVTVFDVHDINFELISIKYGTYQTNVDVIDKLMLDNLIIPKDTIMNDIQGDPMQGVPKNVFVKYRLNNIVHTDIYPERLSEDINYNITTYSPNRLMNWINRMDTELFDNVLRDIKFTANFYDLKLPPFSQRTNAIHIRDDPDAISFWSQINNMAPFEFQEILESTYIRLISTYFPKNEDVLVLTSNLESKVLSYMRDNTYIYHTLDKNSNEELKGREINAIRDLIFVGNCNGTFIGNVNPITFTGSTYSYTISKRLINCQMVLIDLDHIDYKEFVISSK